MPETSMPWIDLGGGVHVRQSAAFSMNSVLLLDSRHTIVVDPGVLPSELNDLERAVARVAPEQVTLFLTHADWDHVLGRPWWPKASVIAHDRFAEELTRKRPHIQREAQALAEKHGERWDREFESFRPSLSVSGLHFTKVEAWRLVFRDAPGHSDSQLSLHLPEHRLLIAGDMLSDIEIPILNRAPELYRQTLEALEPLVENGAIETLIPGHGSIARGRAEVAARLERDREYVDGLESGARAAQRQGLSLEAARERLSAMEYTGKHSSSYPTTEIHLKNVELAYSEAPTRSEP